MWNSRSCLSVPSPTCYYPWVLTTLVTACPPGSWGNLDAEATEGCKELQAHDGKLSDAIERSGKTQRLGMGRDGFVRGAKVKDAV